MVPKVKRISDLRIDNDLTQEEMAKILGISRSKYSQIEIGFLDFKLELLNKFANYFKINVDYIYGLTDKKKVCYKDNIDLKDIGIRLRNYRKDKGLSQVDICNLTGIYQSSYSRYELGCSLTGHKLYVVASKLNLSMDELMGRC